MRSTSQYVHTCTGNLFNLYSAPLYWENGVNLLTIRAEDPYKYALHLMDILFTDEEMASSCYVSSKRTKKPGLDPARVTVLEGEEL